MHICMGEGAEAAKKLSTLRAQLILTRFVFPHGHDPGTNSNARTELRQLNASLQQNSAFYYSNCSQGGETKAHVHYDKLACGESLERVHHSQFLREKM